MPKTDAGVPLQECCFRRSRIGPAIAELRRGAVPPSEDDSGSTAHAGAEGRSTDTVSARVHQAQHFRRRRLRKCFWEVRNPD